jgi:hypothetical protein
LENKYAKQGIALNIIAPYITIQNGKIEKAG